MDFSITSRYKDCLSRQIAEALQINYTRDIILNSKGEYLSNTISRLRRMPGRGRKGAEWKRNRIS